MATPLKCSLKAVASAIFLHPDGRSLLGDFGVAVLLDATRLTTDAAIIGTAAYLAPEQATGDAVTEAADVYALGLVLMEALSGHATFTGSFQEVITAKLGRDPQVPVDLEEPWPALLADMTNRDPGRRPSAAAVRDILLEEEIPFTAVDRLATGAPSSADTVVLSDPASSPTEMASPYTPVVRGTRRPSRQVMIMVATGVVALVVLIALAAGGKDGERAPAQPNRTATSMSTTSAPAATPAPPLSSRRSACDDLEAQKQAVEQQKQQAEQTHRHDKSALERVKTRLEEQKKDIEEQKKVSSC